MESPGLLNLRQPPHVIIQFLLSTCNMQTYEEVVKESNLNTRINTSQGHCPVASNISEAAEVRVEVEGG